MKSERTWEMLADGLRETFRAEVFLAEWQGEGGEDKFVADMMDFARASYAEGYNDAVDDVAENVGRMGVIYPAPEPVNTEE